MGKTLKPISSGELTHKIVDKLNQAIAKINELQLRVEVLERK